MLMILNIKLPCLKVCFILQILFKNALIKITQDFKIRTLLSTKMNLKEMMFLNWNRSLKH
jgi:hypothetical protein